jgi:hypothetical protein
MNLLESHSASFRDPSGFIFEDNGHILRVINEDYKSNYEALERSGLLQLLQEHKLLVNHKELELSPNMVTKLSQNNHNRPFKLISPERIDFISYPYEWCFSQLKDAALLTLEIQKCALEHGMTLKDASAYNVQFHKGKAIFIDTLSFEIYEPGSPWTAYKQFCQHFLAPLALGSLKDLRLLRLLETFIDGIPLDLAAKLLPAASRLNPCLLAHIFVHSSFQSAYEDTSIQKATKQKTLTKEGLEGIITSLENGIKQLKLPETKSTWSDYYQNTNYSKESLDQKETTVQQYIERINPETVWDLGANVGKFSRLATNLGARTVSFDFDPLCVEHNYLNAQKENNQNILPLILDLTNPSSGIGFAGKERQSLEERGPCDLILALALIHHMVIANNVPFKMVAEYLAKLGNYLIIEFVAKEDSQCQRLLNGRTFEHYNQISFKEAFLEYFTLLEEKEISGSQRILYLMQRKQ